MVVSPTMISVRRPPVRGRGLKQRTVIEVAELHQVAPRAGARIETRAEGDVLG